MFDFGGGQGGMGGLGGLGLDQLLKMLQGGGQKDESSLAALMGLAPAMIMKEKAGKEVDMNNKKKEKTLEEMLMGMTAQGAMPGGGMDLRSLLGMLGGSFK